MTDRVHDVTGMPDLSGRITRANARRDRSRSSLVVRSALAVTAAVVILGAVDHLFGGDLRTHPHDHVHDARHLGAFGLAYGVLLVLVVLRPARARTALPVAMVVAGALVITATLDLVQGRIPFVEEVAHVPELASVVLIRLLAVPTRAVVPGDSPPALRRVPDA